MQSVVFILYILETVWRAALKILNMCCHLEIKCKQISDQGNEFYVKARLIYIFVYTWYTLPVESNKEVKVGYEQEWNKKSCLWASDFKSIKRF